MADRYAGIAGLTVAVADAAVVLDLSTPDRPQHTRLRLEPAAARDIGWDLLEAADAAELPAP